MSNNVRVLTEDLKLGNNYLYKGSMVTSEHPLLAYCTSVEPAFLVNEIVLTRATDTQMKVIGYYVVDKTVGYICMSKSSRMLYYYTEDKLYNEAIKSLYEKERKIEGMQDILNDMKQELITVSKKASNYNKKVAELEAAVIKQEALIVQLSNSISMYTSREIDCNEETFQNKRL